MECCTCTNARDDAAREAWAPAEEKVAGRQDGNIDGTWGRGDRARPLSHARFRKERTLRFRLRRWSHQASIEPPVSLLLFKV